MRRRRLFNSAFLALIFSAAYPFAVAADHSDEESLRLFVEDQVANRDSDADNETSAAENDRVKEKNREKRREEGREKEAVDAADKVSETEGPIKRFREGRLIIADFAQEPPKDRDNLDAMVATQVRIHFDFRCEYGRRWRRGAVAKLTRLDVFAVIRPQESWIATPENRRLLDHEQGHFDVAQIAALAARLHMHKQWKAGELTGRASEPEEAIAQLKQNIEDEMQPFYAKLRKAQTQYDDVTSHGRRFRSQREQRRVQEGFLKTLTKKWEDSEWYKPRRRAPVLADVADNDQADDDKDRTSEDADPEDADAENG